MPLVPERDPIDGLLLGLIRNVWVWVGVIAVFGMVVLYLITPTWDQEHRADILDAYERFTVARSTDIVRADDIVHELQEVVRGHELHARDLVEAWSEMDLWRRDKMIAVIDEKRRRGEEADRERDARQHARIKTPEDIENEAAREKAFRDKITATSNAMRDRLSRGTGQEDFMGMQKSKVFSLLGNPDHHSVSTIGVGTIEMDDFQEGGFILALTYVNSVVSQSSLIQIPH